MVATLEPELEEPQVTPEQLAKTAELVEKAGAEIAVAKDLAAAPDAEEKAKAARLIAGTPVGFTKLVLGIGIYPWQAEVLTWFEDTLEMCKGSLCTPNGAGKSSVIVASLALWWITVHPQGMVVITTKDSKQLDNQVWPAIERHKGKFPGYDFIERMVRNRTGGFIIGFTTDDPGRAEGWHKINDFTGPLLIIEDEAKSIADAIDMALDRCTYNAKFLTSSPGLTSGYFYRSHRADQPPPPLGYHHKKVGLADCPHIPQSRIDNILAEYGPDHWFTQSTLYGEFTDADSDILFVIPKHIVRTLMDAKDIKYVPGSKRASCDFAAGRNENVFTLRQGNKITQTCWKDADPMRAVGRFIQLFVENGLRPSEIYGDAGGMGIAILARFNELGWPINPVNNESDPIDPIRYPNIGAEMWHNGAVKLALMNLIIPNDPILFEQLTSRRAAPTSDAILGLESKKDMQKRGVSSPDRADGLVMVLAADTELANTLFDAEGLSKLESAARAVSGVETGVLELGTDRIVYELRPDGWLQVFERPVVGREYLCVLNPHRHDEPTKNHVLQIIRAPYIDKEAKEFPARLAARVKLLPFRLDARPLATMIAKITGWYGRCVVIPIVNDRGDIIERMLEEGLHIYSREEFEVMGHGRKKQFEFGWETDDYTRSLWLGALAEHIREDNIVVEEINTVMQLYQMNSKLPSMMRDAEALGVGLQLINHASSYVAPARARSTSGPGQTTQYS